MPSRIFVFENSVFSFNLHLQKIIWNITFYCNNHVCHKIMKSCKMIMQSTCIIFFLLSYYIDLKLFLGTVSNVHLFLFHCTSKTLNIRKRDGSNLWLTNFRHLVSTVHDVFNTYYTQIMPFDIRCLQTPRH